jgi:copper chaperone
MTQTDERTYRVKGMTCGHCAAAVKEEVAAVGLEVLEVDVDSGRLRVRGEAISDDAIAAAVDEAGYRLAG